MAKFLFVGGDKVIKMDCKWEEKKVELQLPMGGRQGRKYQPQTQFGEVLQEKRKTIKKPGLTRGILGECFSFFFFFSPYVSGSHLRYIFFPQQQFIYVENNFKMKQNVIFRQES